MSTLSKNMEGKEIMKKLLALVLAMLMVFSFAACTAPQTTEVAETETTEEVATEETTDEPAEETAEGETFTVGIIQQLQHNALDAAAAGFQDKLTQLAAENGVNVTFDLQNASGDAANLGPIATKFVNDDVDLILAIGTSAAQSAANATQDIPILVTAVTDPESAGLVETNEMPNTNVSGTSDMNPIAEQAQLLIDLIPEAKTVGVLYCSAEDNSILQADLATAEFETLGLEVVVSTVADSNEIQAVTSDLVTKVDAIYIPTDNTLAGAMPTVDMVAVPAGIPVICGEENMAKEGGVATYSINYTTLGEMTADQALEILVNGADVSTMPIAYSSADELAMYIDEAKLTEMGFTVPDSLK